MGVKALKGLAIWCLALLCTGCFERYTRIQLQAHGSGELVVTTTVQNAYLDYIAGVSGNQDPLEGFNEERLKTSAAQYGKGVVYESHAVQKREQDTRMVVRYSFQDLSTVKIGLDPSLPLLGHDAAEAASVTYPRYNFHNRGSGKFTMYAPKDQGGTSAVHVRVESETAKKQQKERLEKERAQWMQYGNPFQLKGTENREELIRTLGKGMRFRLEIQAMDPLHSTTSRYQIGKNRILIYSVELERLLKDPQIRPLLLNSGAEGPTWSDLLRSKQALIENSPYRLFELVPQPEER